MATRDDKQLGTILLLLIVGFTLYWLIKFFGLVFAGTESVITESVAAFAGAFFAFVFLRFSEFFSRHSKRLVTHYNSLVGLEIELNEIGGIIQDNIYNIDNIIPVISGGNLTWNQLNQVPIDKTHLLKLHNNQVANKLYELFYDIRRMNDDAETFNRGYSILRDALIQEKIDRPHYTTNAKLMVEQLIPLKIFLKNAQEKALRLLAEIRILTRKDKPLATHLMHPMIMGALHTPKQVEIDTELEKLRQEIETSARVSREEKDRALREAGLTR